MVKYVLFGREGFPVFRNGVHIVSYIAVRMRMAGGMIMSVPIRVLVDVMAIVVVFMGRFGGVLFLGHNKILLF